MLPPKQFLRLKLYLHGRAHVPRCVWLDDRKQPAFDLDRGGKTDRGSQPVIVAHAEVRQCAPARDELPAHLLMAVVELQPIFRAEPVIRPALRALRFAPNPASQQLARLV